MTPDLLQVIDIWLIGVQIQETGDKQKGTCYQILNTKSFFYLNP